MLYTLFAMNPWDSDIPWQTITLSVEVSGSASDEDATWEINGSGTRTWTRAPFDRNRRPRLTFPTAPPDFDAQPLDPVTEFAIYRNWPPGVSQSHLLFYGHDIGLKTEEGGWGVPFGTMTISRDPADDEWPKTVPMEADLVFQRLGFAVGSFGLPAGDFDDCLVSSNVGSMIYGTGLRGPWKGYIHPFTIPLAGGTHTETLVGENTYITYTISVA